jgi:hypothetical protein
MKNTVLLTLYLTVLLVACKKSHTTKPQPSFTGTWELRATKGGNILPATFPPGNGHLVIFANTSYTYSVGGSVVTQGTFLEQTDNSGNANFSFSSGDFTDDGGMLLGDTLRIKPLNPEIAASYYVRR